MIDAYEDEVPRARALRSPLEGLGLQIASDIERITHLGTQLQSAFSSYADKRDKLKESGIEVSTNFGQITNSAFSAWAQLQKKPGQA